MASLRARWETMFRQTARAHLRRPKSKATGWQSHLVRGFLAGVVRKKFGLNLQSETTNGDGPPQVERVASSGT